MKISVIHTPHPKILPNAELGFGRYFSDHMFLMNYDEEQGWHNPRITAYDTLGLDPANMTLHYGQTIFEGLKAFRWADGTVSLFRAQDHVKRFSRSAARLCMPAFDEDVVLEGIMRLVDVDRNWAPPQRGTALYLRPTLIADDNALGVRPSKSYLMFVIASPVGNYYAGGSAPTRILVEDRYSRAALGGLGDVKTAANYAASLLAAEQAKQLGFDQVLWLDAATHSYAEEVGTMNIFFVINGVLITPPLGGTILDGMTRRSVLQLAHEWGVPVMERPIAMTEVEAAHDNGTLNEVFGSGTAAVISQVGELSYRNRSLMIEERPDSLRRRFYDAITGVQYGELEDTHGWTMRVPIATNGNGNGHAKKELEGVLPGDAPASL